jgi:hypothetical protein
MTWLSPKGVCIQGAEVSYKLRLWSRWRPAQSALDGGLGGALRVTCAPALGADTAMAKIASVTLM